MCAHANRHVIKLHFDKHVTFARRRFQQFPDFIISSRSECLVDELNDDFAGLLLNGLGQLTDLVDDYGSRSLIANFHPAVDKDRGFLGEQ